MIALKENIRTSQENLYKCFFGMFPDVRTFSDTLTAVANGYGALVLDNTRPNSSVAECVSWYKGKPISELPPFEIGLPELRTPLPAPPIEQVTRIQHQAGQSKGSIDTVIQLSSNKTPHHERHASF